MIRTFQVRQFSISKSDQPSGLLSFRDSQKAKPAAGSAAKNGRASLSARKKTKVEDDDDFEFDDGGLPDEDLGRQITPFLFPVF